MNIGKTLYVSTRKEWRSWLSKNHKTEPEIWLVYYKKSANKPRISYDDAVLEALCFGWIDSTAKTIDEERFAQRFSPRRKSSNLSQMNRERVRELVKKGLMTKIGLSAISHVYDPDNDKAEEFSISDGIIKALKNNDLAWKNFQNMPESYKRIRIAYIESRKRHGVVMYRKALKYFVDMTAQNKRIGFVKERR